MATTSSQELLSPAPTPSDYTSTQSGKQVPGRMALQWRTLPTHHLPLHLVQHLHGTPMGTQLQTRDETMDSSSLFAPVSAAAAVSLYTLSGKSFSDACLLYFWYFQFYVVFQAEHNIYASNLYARRCWGFRGCFVCCYARKSGHFSSRDD